MACGLHTMSLNEREKKRNWWHGMWIAHHVIEREGKKQKLMTQHVGCMPCHRTRWKKKETDDTACGLHAASSNERGWISWGSMWVPCCLFIITPLPQPPSIHSPHPSLALLRCVMFAGVDMADGRWEGGLWPCGRWACPGLAQIWAFSRALSGGSGWPRSGGGGGGVRKEHQHCCVGKLMSEVEMTLHNFDAEHI